MSKSTPCVGLSGDPAASDGCAFQPEEILLEALDLLGEALAAMGDSASEPLPALKAHASLAPGGVVIVTEDDRGIARAVAADLRALGYAVMRVRHGVGSGDVEGVNLKSSAAVAALIVRARGLGLLAAIVHASPLRDVSGRSGDEDSDARVIALLTYAASPHLIAAVERGGACVVVANRKVEIASLSLPGVRVETLGLDPSVDVEVLAADLVRAVLAGEGSRSLIPKSERVFSQEASLENEAILLGAPDRASWIQLASALMDWLEATDGVRLVDLAATLHLGQPHYAFRVGIVASSRAELVAKLGQMIDRLADPSCRSVHDSRGLYWSDGEDMQKSSVSRPALMTPWLRRNRRRTFGLVIAQSAREVSDVIEAIPLPSAHSWLHHEVAFRFGNGKLVTPEILLYGRDARRLDLTRPHREVSDEPVRIDGHAPEMRHVVAAVRLMDEILAHQKRYVQALMGA